jgi:hypothetical protein
LPDCLRHCADHQPNGQPPVSATSKGIPEPFKARLEGGILAPFSQPRALATHEIPGIVQHYRIAAKNAIAAGKRPQAASSFNSPSHDNNRVFSNVHPIILMFVQQGNIRVYIQDISKEFVKNMSSM